MATLSDLTGIDFFAGIPGASLEKLAALGTVQEFAKGDVVYNYDEPTTFFCVVLKGRIMFERNIAPGIIATIMTLNPGDLLGVSALIESQRHKGTAVCRDQSVILLLPGADVIRLMNEDPALGFMLMKKLYATLINRLHVRTEQFLKLLALNPELKEVMD